MFIDNCKRFNVLSIIFFLIALISFRQPLYAEKNAAYYKQKGDEERIQKNYLSSIEFYKKSLKKNSNYAPALLALGSLMRETGSAKSSVEYLNKALVIRPESQEGLFEISLSYLDLNDFKNCDKFLSEGLKLYKQNPDFHYLSSLLFMKSGNIYLAQKKVNRTLKMNPAHYRSWLLLGQIYMLQKRYDAAEDSLKKALLIKPENPEIFVELGKIHLIKSLNENSDLFSDRPVSVDMFQDSVDYLLNAKGYDNFFVPSNFLLGQIYALSGDCLQALSFFNTVLSVNENHYPSLYYIGYCYPEKSLSIFPQMLDMSYNDEITRHHFEKNQIKFNPERKHPVNIANAMLHFDQGKSLMAANYYLKGLYEIRWSLFLFPENIEARKIIASAHRSKNDLARLGEELKFLRKKTKKKEYHDMYEQLISARQNKLYYTEGINEPDKERSPTPLFIFNFSPKNPLGTYPDAGSAIAEKLDFALLEMGRLTTIDGNNFKEMNKEQFADTAFALWGNYSGGIGKKVKQIYNKKLRGGLPIGDLKKKKLRYAVAGSYEEIQEGLSISAFLVDLETGIEFAQFSLKETGRGYLRNLSISLAKHIFENIPFSGQILKINKGHLIINLGERDEIRKNTPLMAMRNGREISELEIQALDMDILSARPKNPEDIYKIQKGDNIVVYKRPEPKKKSEVPE
ncbi:MAG: tetratricopeptide repeat protein [Spirochaetia bacterium]|nr:tetratricopeptide repeat protein [Spirochaetia bacterium]